MVSGEAFSPRHDLDPFLGNHMHPARTALGLATILALPLALSQGTVVFHDPEADEVPILWAASLRACDAPSADITSLTIVSTAETIEIQLVARGAATSPVTCPGTSLEPHQVIYDVNLGTADGAVQFFPEGAAFDGEAWGCVPILWNGYLSPDAECLGTFSRSGGTYVWRLPAKGTYLGTHAEDLSNFPYSSVDTREVDYDLTGLVVSGDVTLVTRTSLAPPTPGAWWIDMLDLPESQL